ncbi:MAG: ATP-binding cassette domain-containing protein [Spirochaetes bacterium]|nr:ATP-binding cassette domain-containing protein [Spirochaetota bacterium]
MDQALVVIENLTVDGEGRAPLTDLSLRVDPGDSMVVFGPEGAGLGSLVAVLLGIDNEYRGKVYYKGRSIKDFNYIERHNHKRDIGYLHGDYGLLSNMSVEENISLPLEYHSELSADEIELIVDSLVENFGLGRCRKLRPIAMTGSEIFRTAYARAIINNPDLLIVDHAFIDHASINIIPVSDNMRRRKVDPNKATLFFTYQPQIFLDFADEFIMFYKGGMVFRGDRGAFLESENPYLRQFIQASRQGPMEMM